MKIMIIDANSILNRSFYGIRLLSNREGAYTNAIYGFLTSYSRYYLDEMPEGVCVCFDLKAPTFRHKEFEVYKAGRRPMPDELVQQIPLMKEILDLMGIPRFELAGYEADDLIGTITRIIKESGGECVIVTGDRDALQLVDDRVMVKLITTKAGNQLSENYDKALFAEKYCDLPPSAMIDLKALSGDKSDNIPGVAGIGDKTALDLICRFRTLEGVYKNIDSPDIRDSVRKKLATDKETAFLSYRLATIDCTAPLAFTQTMAIPGPRREAALFELFRKLELKSLITRMQLSPGKEAENTPCGTIDFNNHILSGEEGLACLLGQIAGKAPVAVHFAPPDLRQLSICLGGEVWTVSDKEVAPGAWSDFLKALFLHAPSLITHDAKPTLRALLSRGIDVSEIGFDTAVAAYLLSPTEQNYRLETLASKYLSCTLSPGSDGEVPSLFDEAPEAESPETVLARAAAAIYQLHDVLASALKRDGMYGLMRDVELPLVPVLAKMEHEGVLIDQAQLALFGKDLDDRIGVLVGKIYDHAGEAFNINSTRELAHVLFEKLGLPAQKKIKTGYSTDIDVLNKLKPFHVVIPLIIEYRELSKLKSTYVDGLTKVVHPADGRIHTTFQQTVTATGRLSSTDPNLQNIPIRKATGSELRRMFVAPVGSVLVDADYSQIELRVLAHVSADKTMCEAFLKGEDIHSVTASQVFHVPLSAVTGKMRSAAKAVNFGIVYGISDFSLAEDLGVSRAEAKEYISSYLENYSGIREYMEEIKARAKTDGYVSTLFGRRRYLPELKSSNYNVRSFGERAALNTPIQGTAADIIKVAMVRVARRLRDEKMEARLILQIHDELILEAPARETGRAAAILKEEMENAFQMKAPLLAEVAAGQNWHDAK